MIGLDTTFIIDFLRQKPLAIDAAKKLQGQQLVTTQVNLFEVFVGIFLMKNDKSIEMQRAHEFFDRVGVLPQTNEGSLQAAEIMANASKKGMSIAATDALVAGILLSNGCKHILTKDNDFERVEDIH